MFGKFMKPQLCDRGGMRVTAINALAALLLLSASGRCVAATESVAAHPKVAIAPSGSADVWRAIDAKSNDLQRSINNGALDQVHHAAFAIRDLIASLVARSSALPPDKRAQVRNGAKYVATLAARLDASGDAKDLAGTKANYAKLLVLLKSIRSNYADAR